MIQAHKYKNGMIVRMSNGSRRNYQSTRCHGNQQHGIATIARPAGSGSGGGCGRLITYSIHRIGQRLRAIASNLGAGVQIQPAADYKC